MKRFLSFPPHIGQRKALRNLGLAFVLLLFVFIWAIPSRTEEEQICIKVRFPYHNGLSYEEEPIRFNKKACHAAFPHTIAYLQSDGAYTYVIKGCDAFPVRYEDGVISDCPPENMLVLSKNLGTVFHTHLENEPFVRISRSHIVNLNYIEGPPRPSSVNPDIEIIKLIDGQELTVGYEYSCKVKFFYGLVYSALINGESEIPYDDIRIQVNEICSTYGGR